MPLSREELQEVGHYMTAQQTHAAALGMRLLSVDHARAEVELPWRADLVGDSEVGAFASGVITTLIDNTCGLTMTTASERTLGATLDLRVDYIRDAAPGAAVFCRTHCVKLTHALAVMRAEVWDLDSADPLAVAQGAFIMSRK